MLFRRISHILRMPRRYDTFGVAVRLWYDCFSWLLESVLADSPRPGLQMMASRLSTPDSRTCTNNVLHPHYQCSASSVSWWTVTCTCRPPSQLELHALLTYMHFRSSVRSQPICEIRVYVLDLLASASGLG